MPYLRVETNSQPNTGDSSDLAKTLSTAVAEQLGKPESFVQVALVRPESLVFGGVPDPCAFAELRSLGLQADQIPALSESITAILSESLGVKRDRIFLNFFDLPRTHWSWDGKPFG